LVSYETELNKHRTLYRNTTVYFTFIVHGIEVDRTTAKCQQSLQTLCVVAHNGEMQTVKTLPVSTVG